MKGTNVRIGGVVTSNHVHKIKVTDKGEIVLEISDRHGTTNTREFYMGVCDAGVLADYLTRAVEVSPRIAQVYSDLTVAERANITEIMEDCV